MKKIIAIAIAIVSASLMSAGAFAQAPAGASSEGQVITNSKPQQRAQAKENARPKTPVQAIGGDELNSAPDDAIGTGKAAAAGQKKVAKRDARHPNRKVTPQGGTPDMVDGS